MQNSETEFKIMISTGQSREQGERNKTDTFPAVRIVLVLQTEFWSMYVSFTVVTVKEKL